jgi:hypothetical protein
MHLSVSDSASMLPAVQRRPAAQSSALPLLRLQPAPPHLAGARPAGLEPSPRGVLHTQGLVRRCMCKGCSLLSLVCLGQAPCASSREGIARAASSRLCRVIHCSVMISTSQHAYSRCLLCQSRLSPTAHAHNPVVCTSASGPSGLRLSSRSSRDRRRLRRSCAGLVFSPRAISTDPARKRLQRATDSWTGLILTKPNRQLVQNFIVCCLTCVQFIQRASFHRLRANSRWSIFRRLLGRIDGHRTAEQHDQT